MSEKPTYKELEKRIQELEQTASDPRQSEERKKIEELLRESEHKLATHLQNSPIGAISWDLDFKTIEWNPAAENIFGFSKAEAMGKHVTELILPEDMKELVDGIFRDLIFEKGGTRSTNENVTKDGRLIICDWYNTALKDFAGNIIGVASLVHDITERNQTFEALKKQKEFNEKIIQTSNAIIVGLDKNHKIKIFNKGAEKITGFKARDVLGRDWFKIFFKPDIYDEMDKVWGTAWGAKYNSYVNPILSKDGDEKIISWQSTGMYDGVDEATHMLISIGDDISERKRAEKELIEREEQYRAVVENTGDYIMRYDKKGRHVYANKNALEATGLPEDQYIGKTHREMGFPEHLCELWEENIESVFNTGKQINIEFDVELVNGLITFDLQLNPEFSDDGNVQTVIGISRDISERKRIEEKLHASILNLDEAVRAGRIGLFDWDLKTNNVIYSSEWKRQIGYEDHEISDDYSEWEKRVHPDDLQPAIAIVEKSIKEINQDHRAEFRFRHKDGSYRWILARASLLLDEEGHPIKMLGSHIDITSLKKLEKKLLQSQKMESIGTLAGGIAHDFNNILGAIIGYAEMAKDDSPKESSVANDLDKVLEASDRAVGLVKQILSFSHQDETEYILLQPASIANKTIALLRPTLPTTIEITQDIDTETGLIFADLTQIHQILMNLCTNAFHAMEETGGRLAISLKEIDLRREDITHEPHIDTGTFIQLSVGDTGAGMTQQVKDKIFDPYFTTKEVGKGTGMGLSIVHGIIKSYGGFITLTSELGKGTVFHVFLPVVNEEELPARDATEQIPIGIERVLFIDDEDVLADMGKNMLERLGYHVTLRKSSLEALETFQNQPDQFDVVITDQTMPGMTGIDLARRMLQIRPDIPIILCTGYSSTISEEKAKSMGIKEFALKPVGKKDIAMLIRKVLNGNQA